VRAATVTGPGTIELTGISDLNRADHEARVRVLACGICGSNLHAWRDPGLRLTKGKGPEPGAAGHEIAAVVIDSDSGPAPGTQVVIEPNRVGACGTCGPCRRGSTWFCENRVEPPVWGFADEMVVPVISLFPCPDDVDPALLTLVEPLACGVHAIRASHTAVTGRLNDTIVAVLGSGVAGLLTQLAARVLGAASVIATARHDHQRDAALSLGADVVIDSDSDALAELKAHKPNLVVEAVGGSGNTFELATRSVATQGEVVVLGLFDEKQDIDARRAVYRETRMYFPVTYGVIDDVHDFEIALEILAAHERELGGLISHRYPLESITDAFHKAAAKAEGVLRVVVVP
jgi:threonine dehydrogenase-like Zn-dependent dehydrogenase